MSSAIEAYYKNAPIVLWVEDDDTHTYLGELWSTESVALHIAGGGGAVSAVVHDARRAGHRHVFGLVDRDFGTTNRPRWISPSNDLVVYQLESHEIENLLLDPVAIAACVLNKYGRTEVSIEKRMRDEAESMVWWMAWRKVMSALRHELLHGFPQVPARSGVGSRQTTLSVLLNDPWLKHLLSTAPHHVTPVALERKLDDAKAHFDGLLSGGGWRSTFSGKEIFRQIAGHVWNGSGGAAARLDLIRAVAAAQKHLARVPPEISDLLGSLKAR